MRTIGHVFSLGLLACLCLAGCGDDDNEGGAGNAGASGSAGKSGTGGSGTGGSSGAGGSGTGGSAGAGGSGTGGSAGAGGSGTGGSAGGGTGGSAGAGGDAGGGGSGTGGSGTGGSGTGGSGTGGSGTGGSGTGGSGTGGSGTGGSGTGGSGTGGSGLGPVIGTGKDTFITDKSEEVRPGSTAPFTAVGAVAVSGGQVASYAGTVGPEGTITIPGVPEGPYLIELTGKAPTAAPDLQPSRSYFAKTDRAFSFDRIFSNRPDLDVIGEPTPVVINASLTRPWQAFEENPDGPVVQFLDDRLFFFSRGADITGQVFSLGFGSLGGDPQNGAKAIHGWALDTQQVAFGFSDNLPHLVRGDKGDELTLLHGVTEEVFGAFDPEQPFDPWNYYTFTSARAAFTPASFTMTDGGTSQLNGAFVDLPEQSFGLDYKGTLFNAQLQDALPGDFTMTVSLTLSLEPGTPIPFIGPTATLLTASVFSFTEYEDPFCNPDFCDPEACTQGCDSPSHTTLPGDYAHALPYSNPFSYGQELASFFLDATHDVSALLPDGTFEVLRGGYSVDLPAADVDGKAVTPSVGLPRDLRVNGQTTPVDQITSGVGPSPEISFAAPTFGTPTSYRVQIQELDDVADGNGNTAFRRRRVAIFRLSSPNVKLPAGILRPGKHYYAQVSALSEEGATPSIFGQSRRLTTATNYTGIFTP